MKRNTLLLSIIFVFANVATHGTVQAASNAVLTDHEGRPSSVVPSIRPDLNLEKTIPEAPADTTRNEPTAERSEEASSADSGIGVTLSADEFLAARIQRGDLDAMYEFGTRILKSEPSDEERSVALGSLLTAAESGHIESRALLGLIALTSALSQSPPVSAAKARAWIKSAAQEGVVEAMVYEAKELINSGSLVKSDLDKALFYLDFATKKGDVTALETLGDLYYDGRHVPVDQARAAHYYKECMLYLECKRALRLGIMVRDGLFVPRDLKLSFDLLARAAKEGDPVAHRELATAYLYGIGTPKNARLAFTHAEEAALAGESTSETLLCLMYLEGRGVQRSVPLAKMWCDKGAAKGNRHAQTIQRSLRDN